VGTEVELFLPKPKDGKEMFVEWSK
jgi:hypothetical protein